jgi:hypothetical protein
MDLVVEVGMSLRILDICGTVFRHGAGWNGDLRYIKVVFLKARSMNMLRGHFFFDGVRGLSCLEVGLGDHDATIMDKLSLLLR